MKSIATTRPKRLFASLWLVAILLLGLNAALSAAWGGSHYLVDLKYFRFPAAIPFKPLILLNAALLCGIVFAGSGRSQRVLAEPVWKSHRAEVVWFAAALTTLVALVYLPALSVNFWDHDWTHRHIAADLTSWRAVRSLFTRPQADGMYRPLAFLSFAIDYRLFGLNLWGYHLQSIALQMINSFLVFVLARGLGFGRSAAYISSAVFAVLAVHYEAVVWPAARFDLLACMWSLISLLLFVRYWTRQGARAAVSGVLSAIAFVLGVLNKETAYAVLLMAPALVYTRTQWQLPPLSRFKGGVFAVGIAALSVALLGVRLATFGNLGGYGYSTREATAVSVSIKSGYSLGENVLGLTPFALNVPYRSAHAVAIVLCYAGFAVALAWLLRSPGSQRGVVALAGLALLCAVPALPVIAWIRPSLIHTRHLYLASVWIALLIGSTLGGIPGRTWVRAVMTGLFLSVQTAALYWNIKAYRDVLDLAKADAAFVKADMKKANLQAMEIRLIGVPAHIDDVWFFDTELQHQLESAHAGSAVRLCSTAASCGPAGEGAVAYEWQTSPTAPRFLYPLKGDLYRHASSTHSR